MVSPLSESGALHCELSLPTHFHADDLLAFHRRDSAQLAERVEGETIIKGLLWAGRPACLTIRLLPSIANATLQVDGGIVSDERPRFTVMVKHMLGLTQPVERFERQFDSHPQIGTLIASQRGLRVPQTATPFEALTWAIAGQQISLAAALSLRRRLIAAVGPRHSSGILCHPDAATVAACDDAALRQAGFSAGKTRALLAVSREIAQGPLPLERGLTEPSVDEIRAALLAVRGIGPWTVEYALLRGFAWLDGSLHGDVAVRRNLQRLLGSTDKVDEKTTAKWLADFSPWRALVAAHLWSMQSAAGY